MSNPTRYNHLVPDYTTQVPLHLGGSAPARFFPANGEPVTPLGDDALQKPTLSRESTLERPTGARKPLQAVNHHGKPKRPSAACATPKLSDLGVLEIPAGLSNGDRGKKCAGLDPRTIDLAVLTAAGHSRKTTRKAVREYLDWIGGDAFWFDPDKVRRHTQIRHAVCAHCVANMAEVRRCTTFRCPFWQYRMGGNPHDPRRRQKGSTGADLWGDNHAMEPKARLGGVPYGPVTESDDE